MKNYFFTKLSGAGNDFILFDSKLNPDLTISTELIQNICKRNSGIGADGVLLINESRDADFDLKYFNADGSTGSICANGARCAIYYSFVSGWVNNKNIRFTFNNNFFSGEIIEDELVKFNLNPPTKMKFGFQVKIADQLVKASFVDTGSPHVIINIHDVLENKKNISSFFNDINKFPVFDLGKEIRYHKDFQPDGVNANFIQLEKDIIKIRTYERGVENETLSCGTGTVAAAISVFKNYGIHPPINFLAKSGDKLTANFGFDDGKFSNISLTGPAKIIFKGEITF